MSYREHDETVPVSDLMGDDYDATVAEINARSARRENPFAGIPDNARSHRPAPSLVVAMAMLAMWGITTLAQDWAAFREVAGLVTFTVFFLLTSWARSK